MNPYIPHLTRPTDQEAFQFPENSRYHGLEILKAEIDGRETAYLSRRFVPAPERFAEFREHPVIAGDRLDNIAAESIGNPEQFWRICDANRALHPREMTEEVGRRLRITLPEGLPGAPYV